VGGGGPNAGHGGENRHQRSRNHVEYPHWSTYEGEYRPEQKGVNLLGQKADAVSVYG
jgi:hypothetical protein